MLYTNVVFSGIKPCARKLGSLTAKAIVTASFSFFSGGMITVARSEGESGVCPSFTPVLNNKGNQFYSDPKGGLVDKSLEKKNEQEQLPVLQFLKYIEDAVDLKLNGNKESSIECAAKSFRMWAEANAMRSKPLTRQGAIERAHYVIGLNVIALKLREAAKPITQTELAWLRDINVQVADTYINNDTRTNLYFWTGVGAATFALISKEKFAVDYQEKVWRDAIGFIRADGTIETELSRGKRALVYHQYAFSALLALRAARRALGYQDTDRASLKLGKLADLVGAALCNPLEMAQKAGERELEKPGAWAFRVPKVFGQGLINSDWERCGVASSDTSDFKFGGDWRTTKAIFERIAKQVTKQVFEN